VLAALYLAGVWLEGEGSQLPARLLPRTPLYFLQIAKLFPGAASHVTDYRALGWLCKEHRWQELDTRAYFPLDPDDKENRFQRVMHFHHDDRKTMEALDEYILRGHKSGALGRSDGIPADVDLGGIQVLALKLPIPEMGAPLERATRKPLSEYPESVRKMYFHTRRSRRAARCGYAQPSKPAADAPPDDDAKDPSDTNEPAR
jgi:hypothetical protein